MPDAKRVIELVFGAVDNTSATLQNISGNVSGLADSLDSVVSPIANITKGILAFEAAAVLAGAAVVGFSIKTAGEFSTSFSEINSLINLGGKDLETFKNQVKDLAVLMENPTTAAPGR